MSIRSKLSWKVNIANVTIVDGAYPQLSLCNRNQQIRLPTIVQTQLHAMVQANNATTNELVARLQAKNTEAFAVLYDDYAAALFGIACSIVQDKAAAEDLLQDIFVKIWKHIDSYDPEKGRLFTWLLNITRNTCKDYLRSKQYRNQQQTFISEEAHIQVNASPGQVTYQDESWALQHIIESIHPKYREIIHWVYICGYTQEKVAAMLDIPIGTVKTRSRMAIKQLRAIYGDGFSVERNSNLCASQI
jgi:RNA polymerase sigma factor (sigma-70 family)